MGVAQRVAATVAARFVAAIPWGVFIRSDTVLGGDAVLVDEAAEPVVSADRGGSQRREGSRWLNGFGWRQVERAVRTPSATSSPAIRW